MRKILHALYTGDVTPWERRNQSSMKEQLTVAKMEKMEEDLSESLSPENYKRFTDFQKLQSDVFKEDEKKIFSYGFTLGSLIMMDIVEESRLMFGE